MEKCSHCKKITDYFVKVCSRINKKGQKIYYYWCNDCNTERVKKYRDSGGIKKIREAVYRSVEKHKEKQSARAKLHYWIKKGLIKKPKHCEKCKEEKIEAHHTDYSKPLEVLWLCKKHHRQEHEKENTHIL